MKSASSFRFSFIEAPIKHLIAIAVLCLVVCVACAGAGSANPSAPPTTPVAATPTFTPAAGAYASPQSITISTTTSGASIYYTSDGNTPTTSSARYTAPMSVGTTQTLKAIAVAAGYTNSSVATAAYTIGSGESASSGLPVLPTSGLPKPSGAVGGLRVMDWAGLKSAVTYTFDDGSQAPYYPQLHATGVRVTFFLNLNAGNVSTWTQAAQDGNELGNHTAHHCRADGTSCVGSYAGSLEAEYDLCTDYIKTAYGVSNVWTTASPYGDTGWDNVAKTRFFLNRGVWPGQIAPNDSTDPYNLLIYGVPDGSTASTINAQIDAARTASKWQIFLMHSLDDNAVKASEVVASINHAKSLGDIWIDSMVNIGAYWAGQKALAIATSRPSGSDTIVTWKLPANFPTGKYVRVTVTGGTLKQGGQVLPWNEAGYYEVALDPGSLTISSD